ncbi:hypothetical protein JAAARDRAFT_40220 [Jaapia argillacea MUCL 33604]|uniref:Rhodanese domain-containing protein n=1 Tax=Jaapia argillacea MUCL 33604 TaxID=933084 RepID=A0A067PMT6_9AGAM|nr:hypothetical protein JAAARDRAFT_40220 [Jaapia argillacea MUCL 33604]
MSRLTTSQSSLSSLRDYDTKKTRSIPSPQGLVLRNIEDIRNQVAHSVALRAARKAEVQDGTKISVVLTLTKNDDERFLRKVASNIRQVMNQQQYLFAVATTCSSAVSDSTAVVMCGTSHMMVQRASMLACQKFLTRVSEVYNEGAMWIGFIRDMGETPYDESALMDALRKASQNLVDPALPPPGSRSINQILSDARARLERVTAIDAYEQLTDPDMYMPAVLVDIRPESQRRQYGVIRGALIIERNVLEWRFDPRSEARLPIANRYDLRVIVFCQEGYTSSLAAAALQDLGLLHATDIIGGFSEWVDSGLPMEVDEPPSEPSIIDPYSPLP